ncbi:MAG: hypothetical protein DRP54_04655 [Spirochaetes bacterium]|nr:MAG: hypothetical protein DRP54_04655 [Spirochaetota bacterium]
MKEKIVKTLLKHGLLATPQIIKKIEENGIENFLQSAKIHGVFLTEEKNKIQVSVKKLGKKQERLRPEDFVSYYRSRYEKIKNILLEKIDAVSINKLKTTPYNIATIGMVREATRNGFILEDPTGEVSVISRKSVMPNDVIAVRGFYREGKLIESEIIYPDIPLKLHNTTFQNTKIIFMYEDLRERINKTPTLTFIVEKIKNSEKNTFSGLTSPSWIELKTKENKITVLFFEPEKNLGYEDIKLILKKRHLYPESVHITGPEDEFVLTSVPDIFWIIGENYWKEVYKGVTVISTPKHGFAVIDLETWNINFTT